MVDLLNCPFCGGKAKRIDIEDGENAGGSCICCAVCNASGNLEFGFKENFVDNWNRRTDLSQAAVAAALEAAAGKARLQADGWRVAWGTAKANKNPKEARDWQSMMLAGLFVEDSIRALITPAQHDALAAHVAAEVAKARAEDAAKIDKATYTLKAVEWHLRQQDHSGHIHGVVVAAIAQIGAKP